MAFIVCKEGMTSFKTGRKCMMLGCILAFIVWICVVVTKVPLEVPAAMALDYIDTDLQLNEYSEDKTHKQINIRGNIFRVPEDINLTSIPKTTMISENESAVRLEYESLVERLGVECGQHVRMGSWHVCISPPYNIKPPCLVYDFGIAQSWSFDDTITQEYNCTLRAFDPTNGLDEHDRSEKIHFYPIGLWGSTGMHKRGFQVTTFKALLERFGETKVTIDYLKIDIENSEWDTLSTMLADGTLAGVKQLASRSTPGKRRRLRS